MNQPRHAPDPIVTASVYCSGRLDHVIHEALKPALSRLREEEPDGGWMLWFIRYAKLGDHVKVRLHGPANRAEQARRAVHDAVEAFLDRLPPADPDETRIVGKHVPSIGPEDDAAEAPPDRSLIWTEYRRSYVTFGPKRLLGDDAYVARMTECLGRSTDLVLETTRLQETGGIAGSVRQRALIRALIVGLGATGFDAGDRRAYLAYHRDWLLRFWSTDSARDAETLAAFEARVASMGPTVAQLRRAADAAWDTDAPPRPDDAAGRYGEAVAALRDYAEPLRRQGTERDDPFTDEDAFPLVFKAFHGVANQVGLGANNEAFIHHLLLRVAEAPSASVVSTEGVRAVAAGVGA
jgi:hypothetical protein